MADLVQPRRRANSIIYDLLDDAGRLEAQVVHEVDNSTERDRLIALYPSIVVPDRDRHIICCRCKYDFGITISSHTVLTNRFLRNIKAGCGGHNAYVSHLTDGTCFVDWENDGVDANIERLVSAAKQPKRLTKIVKEKYHRDSVRAFIVIRNFLGEYNSAEDINWRVQAALRRAYLR